MHLYFGATEKKILNTEKIKSQAYRLAHPEASKQSNSYHPICN